MDTCKAANLYATHPAEFMTYVNAPIGRPARPRPLDAAHRVSDDDRNRLGDHRDRDIHAVVAEREDRDHLATLIPTVALVDPDVTRTLPSNVVASTGFDCMSHALEATTARAWTRRLNPARGVARPVSQGANPFSDLLASQALRLVGEFQVRAVREQ